MTYHAIKAHERVCALVCVLNNQILFLKIQAVEHHTQCLDLAFFFFYLIYIFKLKKFFNFGHAMQFARSQFPD